MILFILNFLDFLKYFSSTFLRIREKPKQTICVPKILLKDGKFNVHTELSHMLVPSAQR